MNLKKSNYKIGDKVFMLNKQKKLGTSKKLNPHYNGPYEIINVNYPNYTLQVERSRNVVHSNLPKKAFVPD